MSNQRVPRSADEDFQQYLGSFAVLNKVSEASNALAIYLTQFFSWFSLPFLRFSFGFQAYSWMMIFGNCIILWFVTLVSTEGISALFTETTRGRPPIDPNKAKVLSILMSLHFLAYTVVSVWHILVIKVRWWKNPLKEENLWHGWCYGISWLYLLLEQIGIAGKVWIKEFPIGKFPVAITESTVKRFFEPAIIIIIGWVFSKVFFGYGLLWIISGISLLMFESMKERNTKFSIQNMVNAEVEAIGKTIMMDEARQPKHKRVLSARETKGLSFDFVTIPQPKSNLDDDELNPTPV